MKHKLKPSQQLQKHWFPICILFCIILASIFPRLGVKNGPLRPEITVKYGCVCLIFLLSGLNLKTDQFLTTIKHYKLHLFIQLFTFCFVPLLVQVLVRFLTMFQLLDTYIIQGIVTVSCMPPPISTAVILTKAVNGNETAAIFNSILGSFLGIFVTPMLLLLNLGYSTLVPMTNTLLQIGVTVLLPLLLGQTVRKCLPIYSKLRHFPLGVCSQSALLLIIFCSFCDTFESRDFHLTASDILLTLLLVLLLQMFLILISFELSKSVDFGFAPRDVAAIVFCSTHKSLTLGNHLFWISVLLLFWPFLGIPILRIMFHGYAHLGKISLPLLVYHPTQIILGGLLVSTLKNWVHHKYLPF